jgi:hypothetical protein
MFHHHRIAAALPDVHEGDPGVGPVSAILAWVRLPETGFFWPSSRIRAQDKWMRRLLQFLFIIVPVTAVAGTPLIPPSPSLLCVTAIAGAERIVRLPPHLLGAIAEVESGRPDANTGKVYPWPWTIDAEGRGQFFATKAQAIAAVSALQAQGVRSIDVGCMQINLMHHPNAFASLDAAFDPTSNALYGARFLSSLYAASGSWIQATAAYHSETPAIGADYERRVMARWQPGAPGFFAGSTATAYRDFAPPRQAYADFQPSGRVYSMFTEPVPTLRRLAKR